MKLNRSKIELESISDRLFTVIIQSNRHPDPSLAYSGFTFRSNIPYAVQRKRMLCAYIHLYLKTRHKLPVYGIRNIRTERKSAVALPGPVNPIFCSRDSPRNFLSLLTSPEHF